MVKPVEEGFDEEAPFHRSVQEAQTAPLPRAFRSPRQAKHNGWKTGGFDGLGAKEPRFLARLLVVSLNLQSTRAAATTTIVGPQRDSAQQHQPLE
jgi:hypothetical protein